MMRRFLTLCRHRAQNRAGIAAVEFAVIAPVLITLIGAAWDLGTAIEHSIRLENAARTVAQYVTYTSSDSSGIAQAAQDAQSTLSGGPNPIANARIDVGQMVCKCPPKGSAIGGSTVACDASCPAGMARYITVTATGDFSPVFPTSTFIPFNNLGASTSNVAVRLH